MRSSIRTAHPRRSLVTGLALALCSLLILAHASAPAPAAQAKARPSLDRGSRIPWRDGSYFLSGANYPYYQYYGGDIATLAAVDPNCVWYYGSAFDYAAIDRDFAAMQASGAHTVRWFLFGDGRGAPEFDANGRITGFDATFFDHLDQAMEIARHHNLYIIWTLWDYLAFEDPNWLCGGNGLDAQEAQAQKLPAGPREAVLAHLEMARRAPAWAKAGGKAGAAPDSGQACLIFAGGHANLVTDTAPGGVQDSFFDNALVPLLQHYAGDPNIIGWEIMNEPEWVLNPTAETGYEYPMVTHSVDLSQMRAFFARFTTAVHRYAPNQYATVGSASLKFMGTGQYIPPGIWSGLGFDYYDAHYYGWMDSPFNNGSPLTIDYNTTSAELDAPTIIGEFPANGGTMPLYLPNVRRAGAESSTLDLRYVCTSYTPGGYEPPCTRPTSATIEYYSFAGTLAFTQTVTVPPYGAWSGMVPAAGAFSGAARVVSNGPLTALVTQTGMQNAGEQAAYTGQDQPVNTLWLARVTNQGAARSRIAVQNTGIQSNTVTINYYAPNGAVASTDAFNLGPRGSVLIDPLLGGQPSGPPAGFAGSAVIAGTQPLLAVAYALDPAQGSDAYNGDPAGYLSQVDLPSVRNLGGNGDPTLYVQNPCCDTAHDTIRYYDAAGVLQGTQTLTLPLYGSAVVQPQAVLHGGFDGTAVLSSDQHPAVVSRSVAGSSTVLYGGTQYPDQRVHFPIVHNLNADGSGPLTTISAQNTNPSAPANFWLSVNDAGGSITPTVFLSVTVPPLGQWSISLHDLGLPAGFHGSAEILWPYVNGQGFPLVAVARDLNSAHTSGSAYGAVVSHTQRGLPTLAQPRPLLEGVFANGWAGALAWSYYDYGSSGPGSWADVADAEAGFDAAHSADLAIGGSLYTPVPTPGNAGTATALAATNTPAWGNAATATAQAQLSGTPQPPCPGTPSPVASPPPASTPTPSPSAGTCTIPFSDVTDPNAYYYAAVQYLFCHGMINGYGDNTFRPFNDTTRAQFAKMLVLSRGWSVAPPAHATFADVPPTQTFYPLVETAYAHGAVSGYQCGGPGEPCDAQNRPYFRPNNDITRGQISKLIAVAMGWPAVNPPTPTFADVPPSNPFYQAIETVYAHGVASGHNCGAGCLAFDPYNDATRAQLSKMLWVAVSPP